MSIWTEVGSLGFHTTLTAFESKTHASFDTLLTTCTILCGLLHWLYMYYSRTSPLQTFLGQLKVSCLKEVSSFHVQFCTLLYVAGTVHSVLIKGDVLISRAVLYTSLCSWDCA